MTRAVGVLILAILIGMGFSMPSDADETSSREWFESLGDDQKFAVQYGLLLVGDYSGLIDGLFGPATLNAVESFQKRLGEVATGVLSARDLDRLAIAMEEASGRYGFTPVQDRPTGLTVYIPGGLFDNSRSTGHGELYYQIGGSLELETRAVPTSEFGFPALYGYWSSMALENRYSVFKPDRFVVSGVGNDGRAFYVVYYSAADVSAGVIVHWRSEQQDEAMVTALYNASFSSLTADVQEPAAPQGGEVAQSTSELGERIGAFLLPHDRPDVIVLMGDVSYGTALEFARSLRARPTATTIELRSDGGLVDQALIIAYEIHERHLNTFVPAKAGCYSACSFIFFAGAQRTAAGELGVHQLSNEANDLTQGQSSVSDILEALGEFGVDQRVFLVMFRTPPGEMHVFTKSEVADLSINRALPAETEESSAASPTESVPDGSSVEVGVADQPSTIDVGPAEPAVEKFATANWRFDRVGDAGVCAVKMVTADLGLSINWPSNGQPWIVLSGTGIPLRSSVPTRWVVDGNFIGEVNAAFDKKRGVYRLSDLEPSFVQRLQFGTTASIEFPKGNRLSFSLREGHGEMASLVVCQAPKAWEGGVDPTPFTSATVGSTAVDPENISGSQSLLLEASDDGSAGAVPFSGTVEWSKGVDEVGLPTLIGKANIPARNMGLDLLIRKNSDPSLPASHLIEINFSVSETFIGGSVAGLPGVLLKNEEMVQGSPLVGVSARVVGNQFLFALSASPGDSAANSALMTDRKWLDIALIYATGRRAVITLEKDDAAMTLFKEVFAAWGQDLRLQAPQTAETPGSSVDPEVFDLPNHQLATPETVQKAEPSFGDVAIFVAGYQGSSACFAAVPTERANGEVAVTAYADDANASAALADTVSQKFGDTVAVDEKTLTKPQCSALSFLGESGGVSPDVNLVVADQAIGNGTFLQGTIRKVPGSFFYLLIVDDEGIVHAADNVTDDGDLLTFEEQVQRAAHGEDLNQLLIAIISNQPLHSPDELEDRPADEFFDKLSQETALNELMNGGTTKTAIASFVVN